MAHAPETPNLYVCGDCYVVHAGTHDEAHQFQPPAQCSACGSDDFYLLSNYPKHPGE